MVEIKLSKFSLREREVGEKKARKEINVFGSSQHTGLRDCEMNDGIMAGAKILLFSGKNIGILYFGHMCLKRTRKGKESME